MLEHLHDDLLRACSMLNMLSRSPRSFPFPSQVFLNRSNNCVLHITIRAEQSPHPSCKRLKPSPSDSSSLAAPSSPSSSNNKALWNLALLFEDAVQCASAKKMLDYARIRLRKDMLKMIIAQLDPLSPLPRPPNF